MSATIFSGTLATSTSALDIDTIVVSSVGDLRLSSINTFTYPKLGLRKAPLGVSLSLGNSTIFSTGQEGEFTLTPYESQVDTSVDATLGSLDVSARNQSTDGKLLRGNGITNDAMGGSLYFNTCKKISVKNCDGPIYIRNFCVNGESAVDSGREVGIEINNSDVVLENCAAARCREAGFKFNNSKVLLSRSAFAYRNYTLDTTTERSSTPGIGFHAINSDVSISANISAVTETGAGDWEASGCDVMVVASRNSIGIKLDNSKLKGGFSRRYATNENSGGITAAELNTSCGIKLTNSQIDLDGLIDVYGNDTGIKSNLSEITYKNLCLDDHSNEGILATNSHLLVEPLATDPTTAGESGRKLTDFSFNGQHLVLKNQSCFDFPRNLINIPARLGHLSFSGSHGAAKWDNAAMAPLPAISIEDNSNASFVQTRLLSRAAADSFASMPSYGLGARAVRNSSMSFYGTSAGCSLIWGPIGASYQQKVAGLYADNNSEINLHGPTVVAQFGVDALAQNQSTINICPPKVKDSWAYDVSGFDLSSQGNHTSVELHSTRACLVANKNSAINMTDLGSYIPNWSHTPAGQVLINAGTDYPISTFGTNEFIGSGSLQFYPNPNDSAITDQLTDVTGVTGALSQFPIFSVKTRMNNFLVDDTVVSSTPSTDRAKISAGGVCVRAVDDSVVNVTNVHFPNGNQSDALDGVIYNSSGNTCERLMIWNIADSSKLNASYCSVSGMYPSDAGYHGPSALWSSSINGTNGAAGAGGEAVIASGAPGGTPDTGSLSILDSFGAGSSVWQVPSGVTVHQNPAYYYPVKRGTGINTIDSNGEIGQILSQAGINVSGENAYMYGSSAIQTYSNQGVFRIYWSPKSSAKFLQSDASGFINGGSGIDTFSGQVGPPYQIFSQGYNMSANCSAMLLDTGENVSSIYPDLLRLSYDSQVDGIYDELWTSGFYYCNEFVEDNPTQCMLDESAADTFANAKNATLGSSGRPRKVTIYRARSDSASNRGAESYPGDPGGNVPLKGYKSSNIFDLKRDN